MHSSIIYCSNQNHCRSKQPGERCHRKGKKRGECSKHPESNKLTIAMYASEHGVAMPVRRFKDKALKESSVRDWKKAYEKQLRKHCRCVLPGGVIVTALPSKKAGRPPLLGEKLDKYLQEIIVPMRS